MEDAAAFQKIAAGDDLAAQQFDCEYRPRLQRFLASRGIFPPDAEDLVQDVFLVVFHQIREGRFRGASSASTWIIGILNHKVADYWKARGQSASEVQMTTESNDARQGRGVAAATEGVIDAENRAIVRDILDQLPSKHRAILLLHETEGWTTNEIAERLKMNPDTVGRKLWEAKRKLREFGQMAPGREDQKLLGPGGKAKKSAERRD